MLYIVYIENDQAGRFSFEQIAATLRARGFDNYLYLYNTLEEAFDSIPLERPDIVFFELRPRSKQAPTNLDFVRLLRQHRCVRTHRWWRWRVHAARRPQRCAERRLPRLPSEARPLPGR